VSRAFDARLVVPAEPGYVAVCRGALVGALSGVGAADELIEDLKLVLSEVCANAIDHGYAGGAGEIELEFRTSPSEVEISVTDHGAGFPSPDLQSIQGGIGMAALRALTTRFTVDAAEGGRGTRVSFARTVE
jgi:serine/threonine-protein kinase RsbW